MSAAAKKPQCMSDLFPSRFLHADQLGDRKVTLTIAEVFQEELEGEKGKEQKPILSFVERPLLLAIPKLNGLCLEAMFGNNPQGWIGHRVTFFATAEYMPMPPEKKPCIRVWGSPDIDRDLTLTMRPRKRKPFTMTMHKVVAATQTSQPRQADQPPAQTTTPSNDGRE